MTAVCGADPRQPGTVLGHPHPPAGGDRCGQRAAAHLTDAVIDVEERDPTLSFAGPQPRRLVNEFGQESE
ncbi:MAG TPA: hypothetical protein VES01_03515 [Dermatophilaceae bacterium]|nr:hypothetical protein [Dermatophilaceae bacterium]